MRQLTGNRSPVTGAIALVIAGALLVAFFVISPRAEELVLVSSDGKLTIFIPDGALPGHVDRSSIAIALAEAPKGFEGPATSRWYDLQPDGLAFSAPVTVAATESIDLNHRGLHVPAVLHVGSTPGDLTLADGVTTTLDLETGLVTTTFKINHFSRLVFASEGLMQISAAVPPPARVGERVAINTIVTQQFGTAEFPPDWGTPGLNVSPDSPEWMIEAMQEIQRETDWFRRSQTFTIPGQGNIAYATVDYTGTLQETGGPMLTPQGVIRDRPYRSAITAAIYENDLWKSKRSFSDYTCAKEGSTQVAWRISYHGFSHRSAVEVPTTIVSGEFQLTIPITCGDVQEDAPADCDAVVSDARTIIKEAGMLSVCITSPEPLMVGDTVTIRADIKGRYGRAFGAPDQPQFYGDVLYYYPGHGMLFASVTEFEGQLSEESGRNILKPDDVVTRRPGQQEIKMTAVTQVPQLPTITSRDFTCAEAGVTTVLWEFPYEAYSSREYSHNDVVQVQETLGVTVPVECLSAGTPRQPPPPTEPTAVSIAVTLDWVTGPGELIVFRLDGVDYLTDGLDVVAAHLPFCEYEHVHGGSIRSVVPGQDGQYTHREEFLGECGFGRANFYLVRDPR